uniref:Uncharacterized protein n=1 Tax=Anas platyrhynchos platyrhynchos TaxID=8840 RepID=A0A493TKW1_ANAPP
MKLRNSRGIFGLLLIVLSNWLTSIRSVGGSVIICLLSTWPHCDRYPRAFRTSRSKRGTRRPGKCLTILSPPVSLCTHTLHFFLCLFVPTTDSHLHPGK